MAKDPKNRYRSVESLIGAIESLLPATQPFRAPSRPSSAYRDPAADMLRRSGENTDPRQSRHALDGRRRGPGRFDRTGPVGRVDALSALDVLERRNRATRSVTPAQPSTLTTRAMTARRRPQGVSPSARVRAQPETAKGMDQAQQPQADQRNPHGSIGLARVDRRRDSPSSTGTGPWSTESPARSPRSHARAAYRSMRVALVSLWLLGLVHPYSLFLAVRALGQRTLRLGAAAAPSSPSSSACSAARG